MEKDECKHKLGTVDNQHESFEFVTDYQEFEHHYDYKYKFKYCPDCGKKVKREVVDE